MNNIQKVRNIFVKQFDTNDCGIACISMILNYAGRKDEAEIALRQSIISSDGLSLLDLKSIAFSFGFKARCVSMDYRALASSNSPCVLHTITSHGDGHYLVCFGNVMKKGVRMFLIADPALNVRFYDEKELDVIWTSRAALFFEDVKYVKPELRHHPLLKMLRLRAFSKTLLITVPFLNICITGLGIALSWTLQRGINDSLIDKKLHIIIAIILLLFLITVCKSLVSFVKQKLLISLNIAISEELTTNYLYSLANDNFKRYVNARKAMGEIRKIQNALSSAIAVVIADGSLVLFIIMAMAWATPIASIFNIVYIIVACLSGLSDSRELAFSGNQLNELAGYNEKNIDDIMRNGGVKDFSLIKNNHLEEHRSYLAFARKLALKVGRKNFWYEFAGTLTVILVFVTGLKKISDLSLSYTSLMVVVILTYFNTTVVVRICNSFPLISEGANLIRLYSSS